MGHKHLYTPRLSHKELVHLSASLLRDIEASKVNLEDALYGKIKKRLADSQALLEAALKKPNNKLLRQDLEEADQTRDLDLQLLADTIKLGRFAKTKEGKDAYQLLQPHFKGLASHKASHYEAESAFVNQLLSLFKESSYQTALRSLNATKPLEELTRSQAAFDALLLKFHQNHSSQTVYDLKKIRKDLKDTYKRLGDYLQILSEESNTVASKKLYAIYVANNELFSPLTATSKKKTPKTPEPAPVAAPEKEH